MGIGNLIVRPLLSIIFGSALSMYLLFWYLGGITAVLSQPVLTTSIIGSLIWTATLTLITLLKWAVEPPWSGLSKRGDDLNGKIDKAYRNSERLVALFRHLPYHIIKTFITGLITALAISTINFNIISIPVFGLWLACFYYLVDVIVDIYLLKVSIFAFGCGRAGHALCAGR